ncbi:GH25 family lysozyme [Chelativorans sp.]|uniref:glycoside hydrolase family 25 protein n=1 Tax=Chelativorans sp. TaxID=2203393 RepID=UPI002810C65E|nr:GH25 family lysozyme [Chelativorans sp.]
MRLTKILLSLLLLAGCSGASYDFSDLVSPAALPSSSGGLRFADNDQHDWTGRAPWHYPVHGTDVSKYQGEVDWQALRRNGISFAFIKATEGGDRVDDMFHRNWSAAKAAGIPRGAYHFYYFCRPAVEQARWFIRHVPRDSGALPPVLDMEWNHLSPTCKLRPPAETVRAEMQVFLDMVERHYGKRPIIYTSVDFFDDNGLWRFKGYPFWLRSVAGHPDEKYDNHPWVFWQYTGTGIVPGIRGNADINVFHGNAEAWRGWLRANAG